VPGAKFCFACGAALPEGAGSEAEAERRLVTVLFGDLSEFTSWSEDLDPERVGVVTDRVLATLAQAVTDFGGHVDKLTGDGLMAVFGAPTAHEDDAERAVRAAARMQTAVRRVVQEESGGGRRLGLRVGLNTGIVLAGIQAHLSYTVVGDTVNTASRLSDAAGVGAVFAGRDTALATMPIASWRSLPPPGATVTCASPAWPSGARRSADPPTSTRPSVMPPPWPCWPTWWRRPTTPTSSSSTTPT